MIQTNILRACLIICFLFSFTVSPSFSLTESVNMFGEINSSDIVLNDIWIEPENPNEGEAVTIHASVYNAGIIPTQDVTDAVTIAYIVNGEIAKINLLENILPGAKNGVVVSSGPVFNALPGTHEITTIINYHDTLSHLRDNPENNIVQKIFQIGTKLPSIISFDTYQRYDDETNKQQITIQGEVTNILLEKLESQEISIDIEGSEQKKIMLDHDGQFLFQTDIEFKDKPIKILTHANKNSFLTNQIQEIFPVKMDKGQSALAIEINSQPSKSNLKNSPLTVILFQDNYNSLFEKISTDISSDESFTVENLFLTTLPSEHMYIAEIYVEGRIVDAFQNYFSNNVVIKKEIDIAESSQIQFRVVDSSGEPQKNVSVKTWIYSDKTNEDGISDWMDVLPTFTSNEPYVAQAIFSNGEVVWSEPFLIEPEEKKVITIIKGNQVQ